MLEKLKCIDSVWFTEKTNFIHDNYNKVTVVCRNRSVTKKMVQQSFEELFSNVKVKSVNSMNVKGKAKRFKQHPGKRANYKKFILSLEGSFDITKGVL